MKNKRRKLNLFLNFLYFLLALFVVTWLTPPVKSPDIEVKYLAQNSAAATITEEALQFYFDVPLSKEVQKSIFAECEKYGLSPALVMAVIEQESNFNAAAVGDSGQSAGLMQIRERWHSARMERLGCTDLYDPCQNVVVGIEILGEKYQKGKGLEWALMAYNSGDSRANKNAESGIVSKYAVQVMAKAEKYEKEMR